ncbi:hypothetical protein OIY81_2782 [Cryptosporidium canis]|uniref:Uncharacterized protein n=1 Tax=Cryptosporidium canis TaxID=195482 RepID=A0ABQ8PAE0_9CRYT|nr:hypothetical protein OIY81_2782 [Cryptosporidium canis]KAJ1614357.1 hypothetical protein OJ252_656 [Cryptosporidium canis]
MADEDPGKLNDVARVREIPLHGAGDHLGNHVQAVRRPKETQESAQLRLQRTPRPLGARPGARVPAGQILVQQAVKVAIGHNLAKGTQQPDGDGLLAELEGRGVGDEDDEADEEVQVVPQKPVVGGVADNDVGKARQVVEEELLQGVLALISLALERGSNELNIGSQSPVELVIRVLCITESARVGKQEDRKVDLKQNELEHAASGGDVGVDRIDQLSTRPKEPVLVASHVNSLVPIVLNVLKPKDLWSVEQTGLVKQPVGVGEPSHDGVREVRVVERRERKAAGGRVVAVQGLVDRLDDFRLEPDLLGRGDLAERGLELVIGQTRLGELDDPDARENLDQKQNQPVSVRVIPREERLELLKAVGTESQPQKQRSRVVLGRGLPTRVGSGLRGGALAPHDREDASNRLAQKTEAV